ncbi:reticulon-like protein B21 isoform X2 [Lotus japonicus]|uniref:reticulon-like protein B21 isoform X2 n=1 Tax=Lotus japonicus TaxID=34305 RepID=UPI0025900289|nr:reticulon-like protein B21 isoform X2 [Lotus japonicus]
MEVSKRRGGTRGSVVAGSVWESRMKSDEVRGGFKVFNADENGEEGGGNGGSRFRRTSIGAGGATVASSGKRKTWKPESSVSEGLDKNRGKTEIQKNSDEQCKELSISSSDGNGIMKSPIQSRKNGASSADKLGRSPIQLRKLRSNTQKGVAELGREGAGQLRKSKSDSIKNNDASGSANNSIQLRKVKSEVDQVPDESSNGVDGSDGGCETEKIEVEDEVLNDDDENCKDFDVCQDKVISSNSDNAGVVLSLPELSVQVGGDSDDVSVDEEDEECEEEEMEEEVVVEDEEIEIEMEESFDVKEISIPESKVVKEPENSKVSVNEPDKKMVISEPENKKVVNEPEPKKVENEPKPKKNVIESEPKKVVSAHMRFHHRNERKPVSVPVALKPSPTVRRNSTIYQNFSEPKSIPKAEEYYGDSVPPCFPQTQSKLQSLVDLIMWRDFSRSTFIFGIGTFLIFSSSYAKDINLSLISVISYIGLVYLAVIFLYRALICRGVIEVEDSNYVLREDDAIWMLRLILPYLNEFLSRLKALFSGDPGTTIKLAVLLFVLARCGSFITIWKMAKFANFWIRRFRDAWDSCTHKKAVALGIFGLVWNLSSVVARIWAVFVLFVAFRYYQQHYLVRDECVEDEAECDETWQEPVGVRQKQGRAANIVGTNKVKKGF